MHFQNLSNGNFGKICSELCSPRRHRGRSGVCFFARSWSPDGAKRKFTLRSLCLCGENRFGFTLLEILIAMFIFAVVLSTIYTSYTGTFRIVDETESQADIYAMARVALERMQEDLESVYIPLKGEKSPELDEGQAADEEGAFVGEDNEIEGRSTDSLRFISRAHLVFSEEASGTAEIAYYVEEDNEGEGFILYRTDTPASEEKSEEGTGGLVLCDSLVSVNFTYHDDDGEVYENWDSTSDEFRDRIPRMVSIKLEFKNSADPEAPFKFLTRVALPVSQG
jgi:general secretion pathway protein J